MKSMEKVPFGLRSIPNLCPYLRMHAKGAFWIKIDFKSSLSAMKSRKLISLIASDDGVVFGGGIYNVCMNFGVSLSCILIQTQ